PSTFQRFEEVLSDRSDLKGYSTFLSYRDHCPPDSSSHRRRARLLPDCRSDAPAWLSPISQGRVSFQPASTEACPGRPGLARKSCRGPRLELSCDLLLLFPSVSPRSP